nr:unnamed protein product [Digitaria exilis]
MAASSSAAADAVAAALGAWWDDVNNSHLPRPRRALRRRCTRSPIRSTVFVLRWNVQLVHPEIFQHVLIDLPGLAFFTTYALRVLFWAEIYYQARAISTNGLRPAFYTINGVVYVIQRFPVESKGRRKKLNEVGYVTTICFGCFMIRCIMMCLSAFDKEADLDVLNHPILNFFYYLV